MITYIIDALGGEWVKNRDNTFRCLSAEIENMTYQQILDEFGVFLQC